jgi:CMP-N-acetylneuraminic acid synthetase
VSVTAVVVARKGSKRLPGKALLPFDGERGLVAHAVRRLRAAVGIDEVVVGSDCERILAAGAAEGARPVRRDAYFCDESQCSANEMIRDMALKVSGETIVWAHPTNPLVRPETYARALKLFLAREINGFDSVVSVFAMQRHAWWKGRPLNFDPDAMRHEAAGELRPVLFQDGAIFIQRREEMLRNAYFYGRAPEWFVMPADEVCDVDTREDFELARWRWARSEGGEGAV